MSGLLVSVRSAAEAVDALAGGADLIDVKDPQRGSLGCAPARVCREVRQAAAGSAPLSAALGELLDDDAECAAGALAGFQFAKVGLAGCGRVSDWRERWARAAARLPRGVLPVAVVYADWETAGAPAPSEVLQQAQRIGCAAMLIDTFDKARGGLFDCLDAAALLQLCETARSNAMRSVLAGSLRLETMSAALSLSPDYIAVRGAACGGDRNNAVDRRAVEKLSACISALREAAH